MGGVEEGGAAEGRGSAGEARGQEGSHGGAAEEWVVLSGEWARVLGQLVLRADFDFGKGDSFGDCGDQRLLLRNLIAQFSHLFLTLGAFLKRKTHIRMLPPFGKISHALLSQVYGFFF